MRPRAGDRATQGLEIGEIILAQADDDPVVLLLVAEGERLAARLDARPHRGRDVVLDEIGQLGDEGSDAAIPLPQGEQLLELIEDQDRREEAVARAPEMGRVEVFPEALLGAGRPGLDRLRLDDLDDCGLNLGTQRTGAVGEIQAHRDGQETCLPQHGEDPGAQERRLAEPGAPEEHRERFAPHALEEVRRFRIAPEEEIRIALLEGQEAGEGVVGVEGLLHRQWRSGERAHLRPALRSWISRSVDWVPATKPGAGTPSGKRRHWRVQKYSGMPGSRSGRSSIKIG